MSRSRPDPWHFARPELAQKYLQTFEIGLISAQALFAPRRMGKSEFLEQDLIPAAQKSGLLTGSTLPAPHFFEYSDRDLTLPHSEESQRDWDARLVFITRPPAVVC